MFGYLLRSPMALGLGGPHSDLHECLFTRRLFLFPLFMLEPSGK